MGRSALVLGGSGSVPASAASDSAGMRAVWLLKNGDSCGGMPRMVLVGTPGEGKSTPSMPSGDRRGHGGQECWLCCAAEPSAVPVESVSAEIDALAHSGWAFAGTDEWSGPGASSPGPARGPPMTDLV
jgi:hypothetical protein